MPSAPIVPDSVQQRGLSRAPRRRALLVSAAALVLVVAVGWAWQRDALRREGQHAYEVGRWEVAYRLAMESLRQRPDDRPSRLLAARSALYVGDFEAAELHFQRAAPTELADCRLRLEGLVRLRAWQQAGKVCEQILARDSSDGLTAQRLAFTCYKRGEVERAIALCRQWGDDPKVGTSVRAMLGWIYFDRTDDRHAVEQFVRVAAANPPPGSVPFSIEQLLLDLGKSLLRLGDPDQAEVYLAQAAAESVNPEIAWSLGRALQQQRKDAEAVEWWQRALDWDTDFVPAMVSLAERALQQQQPQQALQWLTKAATLEPNLNRIHYGLDRAYTALGDNDRAREHREIANRLRQEEEARSTQVQATAMSPRTPLTRVQRAMDEAGRGNWLEAQQIVQELLAEDPGNPQFKNLLERIQSRIPLAGTTP